MDNFPKIFFHVGLGKTGTTYLQYKFFPKLKGIKYIQRTQYKKCKHILSENKDIPFFISREFDQQFSKEVQWFAQDFKNVRAIIVLRKHDSWIASQYRRFIKNGFQLSFKAFFDLENDTGYFKKNDLNFYDKIIELEQTFNHKPLILFHEDLKKEPFLFFDKIASSMSATYDREKINLSSKHTSYSESQLSAILSIGKYIPLKKKETILGLSFFRELFRYMVLFSGKIFPSSFWTMQYKHPKKELKSIQTYFAHDWQKCVDYAQKNN